MAGLGDYKKKEKGNRGYKMKGSPFQRNFGIGSPLNDHEKDEDGNVIKHEVDPDAPGTPGTPGYEPTASVMDILTRIPNPYTKAVQSKDYKIDEKEEQIIENMSNRETMSEIIRHEKHLKDLEKGHDVAANITEGSVESQDLRRKENEKKKKMNVGITEEKSKAFDKRWRGKKPMKHIKR